MSFASPLWLLGLLPWIAVVIWLLTGQRQRTPVPFLQLWHGSNPKPPRSHRAIQLPPLSILLSLLAILIAILAAAEPIAHFIPSTIGPKITIILDRGITMSARGKTQPRWKELVESSNETILQHFGNGAVDLVLAPEGTVIPTDRAGWARLSLGQKSATADTRQILPQLISMHADDGAMIVLSDQKVEIQQSNLIQIPPESQPENIGIVTVSLKASPHTQAMVRIRNDSNLKSASMMVGSRTHQIELSKRGDERNYFVDLDAPSEAVSVDLVVEDDLLADNHSQIIRQRAWPAIEARSDLPPEIHRIIQTYSQLRPSSAGSRRIMVSTTPIVASQSAAIVAPSSNVMQISSLHVEPHAINANLDWQKIVQSGARVAPPPGQGWHAIVSAGDAPLLAIRELSGARQAWIGLSSDTWPRTPEFVVFWTNVFDWLGEGGENFVFRGTPAVPIPASFQANWQQKLDSLPTALWAGSNVGTAFLVIGIALILMASVAR